MSETDTAFPRTSLYVTAMVLLLGSMVVDTASTMAGVGEEWWWWEAVLVILGAIGVILLVTWFRLGGLGYVKRRWR